MTDTAPELKPCPFCGGEPSKIHSRGLHEVVYCKECFSSTSGLHSDRAKAIAAWNTRAPDPDLDAAVNEALERAAAKMDAEWSYRAGDTIRAMKKEPGK